MRALTRAEVVSGIAAATAVGALVRGLPVFSADFPLHDGGLLYSMAGDLRTNGFLIPAFTSYNGDAIPFAYPPLSLYLAAALSVLGIGLVAVLHYVPFLLAAASVPLVYLVVRELLDEPHGLAAAFAYALMPSAYDWIIVGGGLTRATGLVLSLLTVWLAIRLTHTGSTRTGAVAGLLGGLTVLAHPYAAAFSVLSVGLILAWRARTRGAWIGAGVAVVVATIVVLPWVITVAGQHGLGPLVAGSGSRANVGVSVASLLFEDVTGATFSVFLGIALIGFLFELGRRALLVPVWLVSVFAILSGGGWIMPMLPMSILIAVAIVDVVIPAVRQLALPRSPLPTILAGLLCAGLLASLGVGYTIITPLYPLSSDQRAAMAWVRGHSTPGATYAVVTGQQWALDTASEWFPALTGRISLGTAQGYEWTDAWDARVTEAIALQHCVSIGTVACVEAWARDIGSAPDFVYVAKGHQLGPQSPDECCAALREALVAGHRVVYDGPGATIVAWSVPP